MTLPCETRQLGTTDIRVSPVAFGAWPIAGMTSIDVTEEDSLATIAACLDAGVNFIDTAYCYGPAGESERLIARALGSRRDEAVLATKGGIAWGPNRQQIIDGRPATLRRQCDESLRRLATDRVELLYLHAPDPKVPIEESAGALRRLHDEGKTRAVGCPTSASNNWPCLPPSVRSPPFSRRTTCCNGKSKPMRSRGAPREASP
jgi:aryl-alcohol dehydrogenase-like predicted oxidoreductase